MLYYDNLCVDPYFNMALEEYLMKFYPSDKDILMLWQSGPAVLIGRYQNTIAQINQDFVRENDIKIARRITGGGSVYQDFGNVNYSYIIRDGKSVQYNYKKLAEPVIDALIKLGVKAEFNGRNDITIEGRKISGNAQHVYKNTVLHHGTLLLNSDLENLSNVLKVKKDKLANKGIDSVASRVANISEFLPSLLSMTEFREKIFTSILKNNPHAQPLILTQHDIDAAEDLANSKFRTWEWNYSESPDYNYYRANRFPGGEVELYIKISESSIIENIRIFGDFLGGEDIAFIEQSLMDVKFSPESIRTILTRIDVPRYFAGTDLDSIIELFFKEEGEKK